MGSIFGLCKATYRAALPQWLRHRLYILMPLGLQKFRSRMVSRLEKHAQHDEIYDAEYYAKSVEPEMRASADIMAETIAEEFEPGSVVDVGCGTGALMTALSAHGISCIGLEYSQAAITICTNRGLAVHKLNLEDGVFSDQMADLAVSTEVAEHLPASVANHFVDVMCRIAKVVVLTAAAPDGPAGTDHVNEQPNEYWIAKFRERKYWFDERTSSRWRENWRQRGVSPLYHRNVMVFRFVNSN